MATGENAAPPPSEPRDRPTANAPAADASPGSGGPDQYADAAADELERASAARGRRRRTTLVVLLVVGGVGVLIGLLILAMWVVPEWLNRRDFATPAERATAVNAARVPVAAIFAAAVAGLGVWVSHRGVVTARQTLAQTRRRDDDTTRLTQAGQYTDRYIKAIGLINDDKLNARLGGLYALEQLAKEAPLTYHATIVDVLSAYIRERAPWPPLTPTTSPDGPRPRSQRRVAAGRRDLQSTPPDQPQKPALDIQTALTILGRRNPTHTDDKGQNQELEDHRLDLSATNLQGANLGGAHLEGANLGGASLEGANLGGVHLEGANLFGASLEGALLGGAYLEDAHLVGVHLEDALLRGVHLEGANLGEAHLERANLFGAHLERAHLVGAYLEDADLGWAYLEDAHLGGAHLERAVLVGAHLERAVLGGAYLEGANLGGAHLERAHLLWAHLERAHLVGTHLEGANLGGAHLQGANLGGAHLEHADLGAAHLDDGALNREQLATALFKHGPQLPGDLER